MAAREKNRIFIECTQTFFKGGNSGIQRVVRNLANYGRELTNTEVEVYPLVWVKVGFCQPTRRLDVETHILIRMRRRISHFAHLFTTHFPTFLKKMIRMLAKPWRLRKRRRKVRDFPCLFKALLYVPLRLLVGRSVSFRPGDIIVLVDSTWKSPLMLDVLFKARRDRKIIVGAMIHDLFPLLMPENCEEVTVEGFTAWFNRIAPMMNFFVANSEATRKSLAEYFDRHPELRSNSFVSGSFRLGAELDLAAKKMKNSEHLQPIWDTPGRAILAVGTIEPRKNYSYLLDAYDILRGWNIDVSLIIIGRSGWKNADIVHRIKIHPDFDTRLLHLDNASDRDLAEAIERADCLVCPSIAEGFGLPVVEGLMRGLAVFASDIPVFHESGNGFCQFFDLDSPGFLAGLLENWFDNLSTSATLPATNLFVWPDWKESTEEFISLVLDLAESARKA